MTLTYSAMKNLVVKNLDAELESYYEVQYIKRGTLSNALFSTVNSIKSDFVFDYGKRIKETEIL